MTTRISRLSKAIGLGTILALSLGFTACGSSSDQSSSDAGSASATSWQGTDDGTNITMWTRASTEIQAKSLVNAYNGSHKNQVKLTVIPTDDFQTKVGAAAGSKSLPDLLSTDIVYAPNYTSQDIFLDITDRIASLPYADGISKAHVEAGTWDGKKYLLPFNQDVSVLVWNKALFKEAKIDPDTAPKTLGEVAEDAKKVTALGKKNVYGTYFGGNCGGCLAFTWWPSIWADGGEVMNADGTQSLLNSDTAKAVYAAYKGMVDAGSTAPGTKDETGATWTAPFASGKVAVMPYPSTMVASARKAGIDVGVGPIPGVNGGESTFVGGDGIGISSGSKVSDQAWNFLSWMLSDDTQINVVAKNGDVISRSDLASKAYTDKDVQLAADVAGKGRTPLAMNYGAAFNDPSTGVWTPLFRDAVFGDGSKVDSLNDQLTAVLKG